MIIFQYKKDEELKDFQVWFDPFLEELFSMETDDLNSHLNLKNQLLKEKTIFYPIKARSWTHSFEVFREKYKHLEIAKSKDIYINLAIKKVKTH